VREVIAAAGVRPADIAVAGIDAMSSMALPVDASGAALRPGPLWYDRRAAVEAAWVRDRLGEALGRIAGNRSDASNFAPKLLWVKSREPEVYRRAAFFLHAEGFLVMRLTGEATMSVSNCGLSQLCDLSAGAWSQELVRGCGIEPSKLPPILRCTDVAGRVTAEAAAASGLARGTPVIAGAMDNVAAVLGTGLARAGAAGVSAGTATNTNACVESPRAGSGLHCYAHALPGLWIAAGGVDYGGAGLKWFRDLLGHGDFASLDAEVAGLPAGGDPLLFLPYMVGQRAPLWNEAARGALIGLEPGTARAAVARAIMEGNALGTRRVLELVEEGGAPVASLRLTGGCSRSPVWAAIFADVTGKTVEIPGELDAAPLGTALMAASAAGMVSDLAAAAERAAAVTARFEPRPDRVPWYDSLYGAFRGAYDSLADTYRLLEALRR
jgi:sugar (pentulose or hexulose) kinase